MPITSPLYNRGVPLSGWLESLPASTRVLVADSSGNVASQSAATVRDTIGINTVWLSDYANSDTVLTLNDATTGTDQSAAIQAVLDLAATAPLHLIWDIKATAKGLKVRSNTYIRVLDGCGCKLTANAGNALIQNYSYDALAAQGAGAYATPNLAAITKDKNITIEGGIWHGNESGQPLRWSTTEGWLTTFRFFNVEDFNLFNNTIYKPRTFGCQIGNWTRIAVHGMTVDVGTALSFAYNYDGLKLWGNGQYADIRNLKVFTQDDVFSLQTNDADQQDGAPIALSKTSTTWLGAKGPIRDVVLDGLAFRGATFGIRILSTDQVIERVVLRNISGSMSGSLMLFDNYSENADGALPPGAGLTKDFLVENVNIVHTAHTGYKNALFYHSADADRIAYRNITITAANSSLPIFKFLRGTDPDNACTIDHVSIDNLTVVHEASAQYPNIVELAGSATVTNLTMRGVNMIAPEATATGGSIVRALETSTLTRAAIQSVQGGKCYAAVHNDSTATVGSVSVFDSEIADFKSTVASYQKRISDRECLVNAVSGRTFVGVGMSDHARQVAKCELAATLELPSMASSEAISLFVRTQAYDNTPNITVSGYAAVITETTVVLKKAGGVEATLGTVTATLTGSVRVIVRALGTTISLYVRRDSDMQWLKSDGTWQTDKVACVSGTDSSYTTGYNALTFSTASATAVEFKVSDVDFRQIRIASRTLRLGRAYSFDGVNDYASRARITTGAVSALTIAAWVKPTDFANYQIIAGEYQAGSNAQWLFYLNQTTGSIVFGGSAAGVGVDFYANTAGGLLTAGTAYHLAATFNGSTIAIYINGAAQSVTLVGTPTAFYNGTAAFAIGAHDTATTPASLLKSTVNDVRLYSAVKTLAQIVAIRDQSSNGTYDTTNLLGAWWLTEESGTTAYDWSGNAKHLTLSGPTHVAALGRYNDSDVRGYRLSAGVYIPAVNATTAADGNSLTVTGAP